MDKLHITGLECTARIGVHAWEQQTRQRLVIDLVLATDATAAARTDDLRQALNYSEVARVVCEFVSNSRYQLIETLAEALCERLLDGFSIPQVALRLHKPAAIPGAHDTSIELERNRRG